MSKTRLLLKPSRDVPLEIFRHGCSDLERSLMASPIETQCHSNPPKKQTEPSTILYLIPNQPPTYHTSKTLSSDLLQAAPGSAQPLGQRDRLGDLETWRSVPTVLPGLPTHAFSPHLHRISSAAGGGPPGTPVDPRRRSEGRGRRSDSVKPHRATTRIPWSHGGSAMFCCSAWCAEGGKMPSSEGQKTWKQGESHQNNVTCAPYK